MASRYVTRYVRGLKNPRAVKRRVLRANLAKLGSRVLSPQEARGLERARKARGRIRGKVRRDKAKRAVATAPSADAANYHSLTTWFKAQGTTVAGNDYHGRLPATLSHGPVRFSSREGFFLGRVRFYGYRSVDELIGLLNRKLKYRDANGRDIGFQEACRGWSLKWRLYGVPAGGKKAVLVDRYEKKGGEAIRDLFSDGRGNDFA